ncbi:MAG: glutamine synthetase family protein [Solirubrobacterales bacterium]
MSLAGSPGGDAFVLLGFPDLQGQVRGKALRPAAFESALADGATMTDLLLALDPADAPIDSYTGFGIRAGAGDLQVHPEPETLRALSWRPGWKVCLVTPSWADGRPCSLAPREVLRRVLARTDALGYEVRSAFEYEVRLTDREGEPVSTGISYSVGEISRIDSFLAVLRPALDVLGIELSAVHTEAGPGLIELNLAPASGLAAADAATYLKLAVKEVAAELGMSANFMAKPVAGEEGSSGHIHISWWKDGANAFAVGAEEGLPGALAASALAGMLGHLPAASLVLNPTINSYKRLVPGWFAPVNCSWGVENRSAALRAIFPPEHPGRCRVECRRPGADANPYLALAVLVAAAADGVESGAVLPAPVSGDAAIDDELPGLPASLEEALIRWSEDSRLAELLGEEFAAYYATSRHWELTAWQQAVSSWELERYARAV